MPIYQANWIYGYFQKQVPVIVSKRLEYCPHGQCGAYVQNIDGKTWIHLYSYESIILSYCPNENLISFDWSTASPDYSRTTAKHVGAFCKEYIPCMSYHSIKKLWYDEQKEKSKDEPSYYTNL